MSTEASFGPTRWSLILQARDGQTPEAAAALETLCALYWHPIYAHLRRAGHRPHDAEDLTQAFLAGLLARDGLSGVSSAKGKFRSFLLASLKNFLSTERDKSRAQKRGGGRQVVSIDAEEAERCYKLESKTLRPDELFDRQWALSLIERALVRLRAEYQAEKKEQLFELVKGHLTGADETASYAAAASQLGATEGAVKVAAHRMRRRFREILRLQIAETVGSNEEVNEELRQLFATLSQ